MPDPKIDTPTRILDTALALFNDRGAANVTTNHIAEAMGISPGNLCDHHRIKAGIVRGLFARILAAWSANDTLPAGKPATLRTMDVMAAGNFEIPWAHRFFFRDLTMLPHNAARGRPGACADDRRNRDVGMSNTLALLRHFISAGMLEPFGVPMAADINAIGFSLWALWLGAALLLEGRGFAPSPAAA
jgi:AcrR family transcriptional regulator